MKEKNDTKISLSTFLLIIAIIAIIVMGVFIYKLNNEKNIEIQKSADLQTQVSSLNNTVNSLQSKINTISETVNDNGSTQNINTTNNNGDKAFTDEQVKVTLSNYLELMAIQDGQSILQLLAKNGKLKYNISNDKIADNGIVTTNVKFSDYKAAMLNYVSETEFEKNWNSKWFKENTEGYITTVQGGGAVPVYTIKKISKIDKLNYTAQTSYIIDESEPTPSYDKNFSFIIASYNGICVIDSIK